MSLPLAKSGTMLKVNTKFMDDMILYVKIANESNKKKPSRANKRIQQYCQIQDQHSKDNCFNI